MPTMKPCAAPLARNLLTACLMLAGTTASPAAEPLVSFTESRGCRIIGSPSSVARLQEIAAQGTVTWDGKCINGLIDGQGALRHQGVVRENERNRRYAFFLTGSAAAGKLQGTWLRETFNMFEDSAKYWTSLATIAMSTVYRGARPNSWWCAAMPTSHLRSGSFWRKPTVAWQQRHSSPTHRRQPGPILRAPDRR